MGGEFRVNHLEMPPKNKPENLMASSNHHRLPSGKLGTNINEATRMTLQIQRPKNVQSGQFHTI